MLLIDLATSWVRIGVFGFGGGSAMVPLMKAECVDGRQWVTEAQFLDMLATGYALPGPIAAKMSVIVGFETAGAAGALAAFAGVMAPGVVLMLGLGALLTRYQNAGPVAGALKAVKPVVIAMLIWTVVGLAPSGISGWTGILIAAVAFAALMLNIHPAIVIVVAMSVGALFLR